MAFLDVWGDERVAVTLARRCAELQQVRGSVCSGLSAKVPQSRQGLD